ncbi:serine protease inhibitor swm-1-like [Xylocopa sonorina]|uniref:serine protease inhibitor swm-1-like n=1 Tax=Xylocopa sonorina TaxID=1818115 RepID=UPI00403ACB4D
MSRLVPVFVLLAVVLLAFGTETRAQDEPVPLCPVNETWWSCGNLCEPKCSMPLRPCPAICVPTGSCGCGSNYFRNENDNKCILANDCP